jgi:hypothetical protein
MRIERKPGSIVTLVTADGMTRDLEIDHAERILRMPNNGGWKLPDNSPYQFDYYDGITKRTNQGNSAKAEQKANN